MMFAVSRAFRRKLRFFKIESFQRPRLNCKELFGRIDDEQPCKNVALDSDEVQDEDEGQDE